MRNSKSIPSILLSLLHLFSCHASPAPHQAPLLGPSPYPFPSPATTAAIPFTFRNATLDDVDDITTVWYDAFRPSPTWDYIYQFTDDVDPLYRWTCQRDAYRQALQKDKASGITVTVITVQVPEVQHNHHHQPLPPASSSSSIATREMVVSFAMWNLNETHRHRSSVDPHQDSPAMSSWVVPLMGTHGGSGDVVPGPSSPRFNCSAYLDINITRALHLSGHMDAAREEYLRGPLGPQLYLELLATHPAWDGNEFAAAHLRWGKALLGRLGVACGGGGDDCDDGGGGGARAGGDDLPLTLMASPAGYPLYVSEGFEGLKNVTVERLDGKGLLWDEVMKFEGGGGEVDEL